MRHAGVEDGVEAMDGRFDLASHFGLVHVEVVDVGRGQSGSQKTGTVSAGTHWNCTRGQRKGVYARVGCRW